MSNEHRLFDESGLMKEDITDMCKGFNNYKDHEAVYRFSDREGRINETLVIAVHSTKLGPSLGGCRLMHYASEKEGIEDVLELSATMTKKAAAIKQLKLGGGKADIICLDKGDLKGKERCDFYKENPDSECTIDLFTFFGYAVKSLEGKQGYISGMDAGTNIKLMDIARKVTKYIGSSSEGSGDPAPFTAYGVFKGIEIGLKEKLGDKSVKGKSFVINGLGNVGNRLAGLLLYNDAKVFGFDPDKKARERAEEIGVEIIPPDFVYAMRCDVFSPCGPGGSITYNNVDMVRRNYKIVAGAENNLLKHECNDKYGSSKRDERLDEILHRNKVLVIPDFVINAGGLINVAVEYLDRFNRGNGYDSNVAIQMVGKTIPKNILSLLKLSKKEGVSPYKAAEMIVKKRLGQL